MKRRPFLLTTFLALLGALLPRKREKRLVVRFDQGKDSTLVTWLVHPQGDGRNWVEPYTPEQLRDAKPAPWPSHG